MREDSERLHRPDPPRDRPIRDFSAYARNYGWSGRGAGDDPVSQGVKLGYSVLEEQMREGQRLAERLRGAAAPGQPPLDVSALIERALNIYRDIGALAFAATEALARNPTLSARSPAAPPAAPASRYAFEISSTRRVTVKLDLRGEGRPRVGPLQAHGEAPAIRSVSLESAPEPVLKLEIADDQPAGVYNAVIADSESGEPLGTLTVRIPA